MKKIFKLLLVVLCLSPLVVKADMGAPMIRPFEAIVTKKGGITGKTYDNKKKHYEENSKVKVSGYSNKYFILEGDLSSNYDEYEVSKEDAKYLVPVNKEVGPLDEGVKKLNKTIEFEVVSDKMTVYKGPATAYEEAGHLNKGDQVTAFYAAESEESLPIYYYIQEESLKGWILIDSSNENEKTWIVNAQPLKMIITKDTTINNTEVKANSIYKINYWSNAFLGTGPVIKVNNEFVEPEDETYEIIADSKKKQSIFKMEQYNFTLKKDTKLYTTYSLSEEIATIPAQTELSTINLVLAYGLQDQDVYYLYVNYNNKLGWIKVKAKDVNVRETEYAVEELVSPYIDPEGDDGEDDAEETTQVVEENSNKNNEKKVNSKETIIIAVISAISVAILALGTIIVLNKKNKKDTLKDINEELEKTQNIEIVKEDKEEK